jgi:hypothetical protein
MTNRILLFLVLTSCSKLNDTEQTLTVKTNTKIDSAINSSEPFEYGDLLIIEFCPTAQHKNEFGEKADWIELFNNSNEVIHIKKGDWSITDNPNNCNKFYLPTIVLKPTESLIIWCDKEKEEGDNIHANFKLSSKGEFIGVYFQNNLINGIQYDSVIDKTKSKGQINNGVISWTTVTNTILGERNIAKP